MAEETIHEETIPEETIIHEEPNNTKAHRQKLATYKWRQTHREYYLKLNRKYEKKYRETSEYAKEANRRNVANYYEKNKERILQRQKDNYQRKKLKETI